MQEYDNPPGLCRATDKTSDNAPTLPREACLPINRCNLPTVILGGLSFQRHPTPLKLDGVEDLHRDLFHRLDKTLEIRRRAEIFQDYVTVHFRLEHLDEAGLTGRSKSRAKANYMRMIRGWNFDSDSREGAVMKAWVESRFGLLPRYHGGPIRNLADSDDLASDTAYRRYQEMRVRGLYGANALEAQLDLVYAYCQYEFARQTPQQTHLTLYRGVNRLEEYERLHRIPRFSDSVDARNILLFNNLNSFTGNPDRAGEFGDYILTLQVPVAKILFHNQLLPGILQGEDEFLVIGGVYEVENARV
ncbi:MAG: NAD(+)--dinitrogen-reductase ADP-D-ribosyltransferase [Candidatus Accumulibacter sp.]|jgi:NAD+--dinitrogen-reductase ADP-D-ribosyltransferase|nr:NAD(+)--dinitrogen-reductase ADP-D-ribosyltransferase [Accumulibacter sp.]